MSDTPASEPRPNRDEDSVQPEPLVEPTRSERVDAVDPVVEPTPYNDDEPDVIDDPAPRPYAGHASTGRTGVEGGYAAPATPSEPASSPSPYASAAPVASST